MGTSEISAAARRSAPPSHQSRSDPCVGTADESADSTCAATSTTGAGAGPEKATATGGGGDGRPTVDTGAATGTAAVGAAVGVGEDVPVLVLVGVGDFVCFGGAGAELVTVGAFVGAPVTAGAAALGAVVGVGAAGSAGLGRWRLIGRGTLAASVLPPLALQNAAVPSCSWKATNDCGNDPG